MNDCQTMEYDFGTLQVLGSIWDCYGVFLELQELPVRSVRFSRINDKKMRILAVPLGRCTSRLYQD